VFQEQGQVLTMSHLRNDLKAEDPQEGKVVLDLCLPPKNLLTVNEEDHQLKRDPLPRKALQKRNPAHLFQENDAHHQEVVREVDHVGVDHQHVAHRVANEAEAETENVPEAKAEIEDDQEAEVKTVNDLAVEAVNDPVVEVMGEKDLVAETVRMEANVSNHEAVAVVAVVAQSSRVNGDKNHLVVYAELLFLQMVKIKREKR